MKMRKLFLSMLAIAGMLSVSSCTKDEMQGLPSEGDFVEATFTIGTGEVLNTRAWVNGEQIGLGLIGDGSKADVVACAVYDSEGNELTELTNPALPVENKQAVFTARLAKGQSYRVAFFAYNKDAEAYDVTDLKDIKVKNAQNCNNDNRDAFTAYTEVSSEETMNSVTKNVTLKRPFAQLNLGIDDTELEDARKAGVVVAKSYIKVSNVYDSFSAYDNAVVTTDEPVSMEFALSAIPGETLDIKEGDKVNSYTYLAMNYLLVGNVNSEKTLTDIEFVWENLDGSKTNSPATKFINIPVERNYRTNIIGKLITSPATFNISIDQNFTGDKNHNPNLRKETVNNVSELLDALKSVKANEEVLISFGANISGNVTVYEKSGASVMIDGCGYTFDGTFDWYGNSDNENATTIFKNINFETSEDKTFIYADYSSGYQRYPDNITVDNCSFTATGSALNTAVGVKVRSLRSKLIIRNSTSNGLHTLLQTNSCDKEAKEILIDNVKINDGKNGLSFRNSDAVVVSNSSINTNGYGIRADGYTNYSIKIMNNNITAAYPVAITNMTGDSYSIKFEGTNELNNDGYQVIITGNKDEDKLENPTGSYTLDGADDFNVYPRDLLVGSEAELRAAYKDKVCNIVKLTSDITVTDKWDSRYAAQYTRPIVLDGANHKITFTGEIANPNMNMVFDFDEEACVKNLTIDMSQATISNIGTRAISAKKDLFVDNCTFIGNPSVKKSGAIYYAEGNRNAKIDMSVSVKNSTFIDWSRRGISDSENGEDIQSVVIEGNTFTNANVYVSAYENITFVDNKMTGSEINITSYTSASTAKVKAMGNTLDAEKNNVIGSSSKQFNAANVEAQSGIVVNAL